MKRRGSEKTAYSFRNIKKKTFVVKNIRSGVGGMFSTWMNEEN